MFNYIAFVDDAVGQLETIGDGYQNLHNNKQFGRALMYYLQNVSDHSSISFLYFVEYQKLKIIKYMTNTISVKGRTSSISIQREDKQSEEGSSEQSWSLFLS